MIRRQDLRGVAFSSVFAELARLASSRPVATDCKKRLLRRNRLDASAGLSAPLISLLAMMSLATAEICFDADISRHHAEPMSTDSEPEADRVFYL